MDAILKAKRSLQADGALAAPPVAGAFSRMKLGMNMQPYNYWERLPGAVNMMNGAGGFEALSTGAAPVDVDGWPTADFKMTCRVGPATGAAFEATISFTGQATVAILSQRVLFSAISAVTYNSATNQSTCTAMCTPTGVNNVASILSFTNTKRTPASTLGSGVTNVDMRRTDRLGFVGFWEPELITYLKDFASVVRTMDMQDTNNDAYTTTWADRRKGPMDIGRVENLVRLAAEANVDLWMQIPMNATPDWENNFFTYLRDNLPAQRVVHFGYCNETWNFSFGNSHTIARKVAIEAGGGIGTEAGRAIVTMARAGGVGTITVDYAMDRVVGQHLMVTDGTGIIGSGNYVITAVTASTLSFASPGVDGSAGVGSNTWFVCNEALTASGLPINDNVYGLQAYWTTRRLLQSAERCRVIVGDAAMRTRFRPIIENQGVEQSAGESALQNAKTIVESMGFTWANQKHVYGIAGAPYAQIGQVAGIWCQESWLPAGQVCPVKTEAEYLTAFLDRMNNLRSEHRFQEHTANAEIYGVKTLCYEGGADNNFQPGAANIGRMLTAKGSQAFADAHLQMLRDLGRSGNDLYMHFSSSQSLQYWGFTDDIKVVTPFWQSFRDYSILPALAPQNVLTAIGTTVIDGRSTVGTWQTAFTTEALPGLKYPTTNRARWMLYVDTACVKTLTLNFSCDYGPMHIDVQINGVIVASNVTLAITGPDLTVFQNVIVPNVALTKGLCVLDFIALENHGVGNDEAFKLLTFS